MEQDITFNKLITKLEEFQKRHPQLNSFGFGNLIEFGKDIENTTPLYPLMFIVPQGITYQESLTEYSLQIFFADRLNNDNEGSISVVSSMSQIARDLLGTLKLNEDFMYLGDYNFPLTAAPFLERFNDVLAGVSLTLNINVSDYLDICQLNEYIDITPERLSVVRFDDNSQGSFVGDYTLLGNGYYNLGSIVNGDYLGNSYALYGKDTNDGTPPNHFIVWDVDSSRFEFVEARSGGSISYGYSIPTIQNTAGVYRAQQGLWSDPQNDKVEFYYLTM